MREQDGHLAIEYAEEELIVETIVFSPCQGAIARICSLSRR